MHREEIEARLAREFERQVQNLIRGGYPEAAGIAPEALADLLAPLGEKVGEIAASRSEIDDGRIPFVIVVKADLVAVDEAMPLVEAGGAKGYVGMQPVDPRDFTPIAGVDVPGGPAYLLTDVDTGRATLNVTPDDALPLIAGECRSPLTIEEGVAVLAHYPDVLKTKNCFSLLGSRRGDRRVAALWISRGRPRLGWCWAGNPHTWLGSASCGGRVGAGSPEAPRADTLLHCARIGPLGGLSGDHGGRGG